MNVFAKIINKEIPANIIYEDNKIIAFYDIKPMRPGHFLVVPKVFSENFYDIKEEDLLYLVSKARQLALKVTKDMSVNGFNIIINNGSSAGQEVLHTHVHVVPAAK